ncbi:MAG TPA: HEAT repeat domain-containing protein [Gemmataceae bacterium]|nr:HEAT repeat domain-containing protein [Gemmataceae bacterium]
MRNIFGGICLLLLVPGVSFPVQKDGPKLQLPMPKGELPAHGILDDQKLLRRRGLGVDGPALLDYFKKRTFRETNPREVSVLIVQLGDEDFEVREHAYDRLLTLGGGALAGIKEAEKSKDAEVNRRADELRRRIEAKAEPNLQAAAARLIATTRPAGAAEVLLNYLPFAADQQVTDELCKSLAAVAVVAGKLEPCVVEALADKVPVKRAAAAEACARARLADQLPVVRGLLHDADPSVRLRVALALVPLKEREILPVLVDLLGLLSPEELWPVEQILVRLAGEQAPPVSLGTSEAARKACRDAWRAWFDRECATIDLARLTEARPLLGYTLVVQQNINRNGLIGGARRGPVGEVLEFDAHNNQLWKFDVPTYAVDAQIVEVDGAERVLMADYQGAKVSERDFKGEVKWEKHAGGSPIGVQRLANGNTFVVMQNRLVEIDRAGKTDVIMERASHDIYRARKLRGGDVVFVTSGGKLTRLDGKSQKVLASFDVSAVPVPFGSIDVLADGGVLMPDFQQNRVIEYSADGKPLRTFNVQWPNSVMRLPNGHTLVSSHDSRRIAEFDSGGREVWTHVLEGMPFNSRRR